MCYLQLRLRALSSDYNMYSANVTPPRPPATQVRPVHRQLNFTKRSTLSKVRQPWHANNMSLQVLMGTAIRNSMERDGSRHWRDGPS